MAALKVKLNIKQSIVEAGVVMTAQRQNWF